MNLAIYIANIYFSFMLYVTTLIYILYAYLFNEIEN